MPLCLRLRRTGGPGLLGCSYARVLMMLRLLPFPPEHASLYILVQLIPYCAVTRTVGEVLVPVYTRGVAPVAAARNPRRVALGTRGSEQNVVWSPDFVAFAGCGRHGFGDRAICRQGRHWKEGERKRGNCTRGEISGNCSHRVFNVYPGQQKWAPLGKLEVKDSCFHRAFCSQ